MRGWGKLRSARWGRTTRMWSNGSSRRLCLGALAWLPQAVVPVNSSDPPPPSPFPSLHLQLLPAAEDERVSRSGSSSSAFPLVPASVVVLRLVIAGGRVEYEMTSQAAGDPQASAKHPSLCFRI